jgi:NAD(P)H dehydrogenase (quinone)
VENRRGLHAAAGVIALTGATGAVGGRVAARLAERSEPLRLAVRDAGRAPQIEGAEVVGGASYADGEAMRRAFDGAQTVFLVSGGEARDRADQHRSAVDAAVAAGVERIVYLSFLAAAPDATFTFARDHFQTEQHVRQTGVRLTFLRDSIYLDYVPFFAGKDGVIRGPADEGRVAAVARDDIADVAAAVLTTDGHDGQAYDVTGSEAFTLSEAAEELSRVTGRQVTFVNETLEEARASRAPSGEPDWVIEGWVTTYAAIAAGELDVISDTVERLAGHRPRSLSDLLHEHPESYAHLLSG